MCVTLLKLECMFCTSPKNVLLLAIVLYLLLYQEAIKTLFILSYLISYVVPLTKSNQLAHELTIYQLFTPDFRDQEQKLLTAHCAH